MYIYFTLAKEKSKGMEKREKLVLFFSLSVMSLAAIIFLALPRILDSFKPHNPNFIGLSTHSQGDVKIKFGDSLTWRKLDKKGKIYSRSYLFTGPNSTSSLAFLDKSTIKLDPNSLVSLNFDIVPGEEDVTLTEEGLPALKIGVLEGKVGLQLKPNSQVKKIEMEQSVLKLGNEATSLLLESGDGDKVAVLAGGVTMRSRGETYQLKTGEKLGVQGDEVKKEEVPDELLQEMKRIAMENDRQAFEEEKRKRQLSYLLSQWYNYLTGNLTETE